MRNTFNLFEYQKKTILGNIADGNEKNSLLEEFDELEVFLDDIWNKRPAYENTEKSTEYESGITQKFLEYHHASNTIKSNNYVGVIHFKDHSINLLPKIFSTIENQTDNQPDNTSAHISACYDHILWWLSYCRKIRFPNYESGLSSKKDSFFEVIIYLFAKYTSETLNEIIYQNYIEVAEETHAMKGRLDMPRYIQESLGRGRWHTLQCVFEKFSIDNKLNRAIKYVSTMLYHHTKEPDSKKYLDEILFILDEVSNVEVTSEECRHIHIPMMFEELITVRDYCTLFLDCCISFNHKDELNLFAFLLPMEYVFEDFVYGFIEKECPELKATAHSTKWLAEVDGKDKFQIKPDLVIEIKKENNIEIKKEDEAIPSEKFIADTKYKLIYPNEKDIKDCISQADLYQMLSYAIRLKISTVMLLYPEILTLEPAEATTHTQPEDVQPKDLATQSLAQSSAKENEAQKITITDEFSEQKIIIMPRQIPIFDRSLFYKKTDTENNKEKNSPNMTINQKFEKTKEALRKNINSIFRY